MNKSVERLVNDVFKQASTGVVKIGDENFGYWFFYTKFFEKIEGISNVKNSGYPVINIPNYETFINSVEDYLNTAKVFYKKDQNYFLLNDYAFSQKLFLDLITNATNYDFNNFIPHIQLRKRMLQSSIKTGEIDLGKYCGLQIVGEIKKNISNLETPFKMSLTFKENEFNEFKLPSISFAIIDDKAYVMAVQNQKEKQENPLAKKLDRYFRKVNKDVDESDVIANVSPNALVSLTLFNSYLKQIGVKEVIAPNFMPIRYNANKISGYLKAKTSEERHEFLNKHNKNQFNITNKFMYLFMRYSHHFTSNECYYDPIKEEMHTHLSNAPAPTTDNIIYELDKSVNIKSLEK